MISQNLQSLRDRLHEYVDTGVQLDAKAVFMICAVLEAAIDDAQELEARTVPVADQVGDLPENVVRIATALARKGVRVGACSIDRDPGGAA